MKMVCKNWVSIDQILTHPRRYLVIGHEVSSIGHYIAEFLKKKYKLTVFSFNPKEKAVLEIVNRLNDLPNDCVVIVEDTHEIFTPIRMTYSLPDAERFLAVSKYDRRSIVGITPYLGKTPLSYWDTILFRPPFSKDIKLSLHIENNIIAVIKYYDLLYEKIEKVFDDTEDQKYVYIMSDDPEYEGLVSLHDLNF